MTVNTIIPQWSGGFCATYKLEFGSKRYAYRVPFIPNKIDNYRRDVIDLLSNLSSPYFAKFGLEEKSLLVNGQLLDVTYMEWIEGKTIGEYIKDNHGNSRLMSELAEKFKDLIRWLYQNDISHGDLNDSNIMVKQNEDLLLIDYDTLCFSDISEEYDEISPGKADYQHPSRMKGHNRISIKADYFSALVIYISLIALSLDYKLYDEYFSAGNNMLFKAADFSDFGNSKVYKGLALLANNNNYLHGLLKELVAYCKIDNYLMLAISQTFLSIDKLKLDIEDARKRRDELLNQKSEKQEQISLIDLIDSRGQVSKKLEQVNISITGLDIRITSLNKQINQLMNAIETTNNELDRISAINQEKFYIKDFQNSRLQNLTTEYANKLGLYNNLTAQYQKFQQISGNDIKKRENILNSLKSQIELQSEKKELMEAKYLSLNGPDKSKLSFCSRDVIGFMFLFMNIIIILSMVM
ncbi:MAG: hypothetical protein K2X04_05955 [Burkholderiales bacterium]|jgi:serine/threonine protein kinase|nr:hypothetical protein [Burkholderiales bacterium]